MSPCLAKLTALLLLISPAVLAQSAPAPAPDAAERASLAAAADETLLGLRAAGDRIAEAVTAGDRAELETAAAASGELAALRAEDLDDDDVALVLITVAVVVLIVILL